MKFFIFVLFVQFLFADKIYYYKNNQKIILTPISSISRENSALDYYKNDKDIILGVSDKLIVKFKDETNLKNALKQYSLKIEKSLSKNLYLLKTTNKKTTIDISNQLSTKQDVKYAHPDFVKKMIRR